jgi:hypothetical protein
MDKAHGPAVRPIAKATSDRQESPMTTMKTLSLVKGRHRFYFRYEAGQEAKVLDSLVEMVNRRDLSFDWFDAAILSHQLGQHLAKELKAFLPKKVA